MIRPRAARYPGKAHVGPGRATSVGSRLACVGSPPTRAPQSRLNAVTAARLLPLANPRTFLDMLVPQMDETEATGGLENFIEGRRHNVQEVREALERIREGREKVRQHHNAAIQRPLAGARVARGDLVLARERDSSLHQQGMGPKLVHEK